MAKLSGGWSVKSDAGVTHAKAAKVFLDGSCRCICVEVLRRAALERSPCSLLVGRTRPSMRRWVRCQCVGPTIPDRYDMWLAAMLFKPEPLSHSMKWQNRRLRFTESPCLEFFSNADDEVPRAPWSYGDSAQIGIDRRCG